MEILKDPDLYPVEFVLLNIKRYDVCLVVSSHKVCFKLKSIKQGLERPNLNNKFPKTEIRQRYRTDKVLPSLFVTVTTRTASIFTFAVPASMISRISAALNERSIILPATKGPRSFTLTTIVLLFTRFVTLRDVLMGRVLCAAEILYMSKISPFEVSLP